MNTDENKMAKEIVNSIPTRVLDDLQLLNCPNCGGFMEQSHDGPAIDRIDDSADKPRFAEYVGFRCDECGAYVIVQQVYEAVSIEAAVNLAEVKAIGGQVV